MLPANKTFRVFVSSTFSDLQEERNALHRLVFPRLRELCQRYGARFQAIDLRWGVSDEAAHEQHTMAICLGEIARCQRISPRPNFLLLLGQRYGWCPVPAEIAGGLFSKIRRELEKLDSVQTAEIRRLNSLYLRDENAQPPVFCLRPRRGRLLAAADWAEVESQIQGLLQRGAERLELTARDKLLFGASATEQETYAGAMDVAHARQHIHFFFREIRGLPQNNQAKVFLDYDREGFVDEAARRRLAALKKKLLGRFGENVHQYSVHWRGRKISTQHLSGRGLPDHDAGTVRTGTGKPDLCRDVYFSLAGVIQRELSQWQRQDALEREIQQHEQFASDWGNPKFFTGRRRILHVIADYLRNSDARPLTIYGSSGSGKSAVVARAVALARRQHPNAETIFRFLGVTPESSDVRALLESLSRQIARSYGDRSRPVPTGYLDLIGDFAKRLELANRQKPLIIFIDALDQLSEQNGARFLSWLPKELPRHVRMVLSTLPEPYPCLPVLQARYPKRSMVELTGLPAADGSALLSLWLKHAARDLQPPQSEALLEVFARCPLPLWLKLAFAEARRWHSYDRARTFADDVPALIRTLFANLQRPEYHGPELVSFSLGFLGASKNGLSEDELLDLLSQDKKFFKDFLARAKHAPPERRLPVGVWSRLFFDLEPYLTERQADGTSLLAFFHRQFRETVEQNFLRGRDRIDRHVGLARYFGGQPNVFGKQDQVTLNVRKLSELPYQQTRGGLWSQLEGTLCDLAFIETKCTADLTYDLLADYDRALGMAKLPTLLRHRLSQFSRFLRAQSHLLASHPELTFQQALNEPDDSAPARAARQRLRSVQETRAQFDWLNKPQSSACLLTCVGHVDIVNSCDVSPDGQFIISASSDKEIKIWDARSGKELRSLIGHRASVETCAFSPDGQRIVSGGRNGEVKLWDALSGKEVVRIPGHRDAVATVAFSPNGQWLASASYDKSIRIWDARNGRQLHSLRGHTAVAVACAFSPDSLSLASGASDGTLKLWDVRTGRERAALAGHESGVWKCAFSPDGKWLVSSSEDGTIKRWMIRNGELLNTFTGHSGEVWTCAVSPDGRRLISGSIDKTVRLWDARRGRELAAFEGHADAIWGVAFFPNGRQVVSASWDRSLKVWDVAKLDRSSRSRSSSDAEVSADSSKVAPHEGPIISCASSPDSRLYAFGGSDGTVRLWNAVTGQADSIFAGKSDYIVALGFSPDGKWLLAGGWAGDVRLINVSARIESAGLKRHRKMIRCCVFTADGSKAMTSSAEKIQLWQVGPDGLRPDRTWRIEKQQLKTADLSSDGKQLVVGINGELFLWPIPHGRRVKLGDHPQLAFCSFSPDGKRVVSSSSNGEVVVWDVRKRRKLETFVGHVGTVESCRFSPDSKRIVSTAWDHTARIWSIGQRSEQFTLTGHTDQLQDACFVADGKRVLSAGMDGTFRVWDSVRGSELGMLVRPPNQAALCGFSRDGKRLVSGSHRCALKLWDPNTGSSSLTLRGHESDVLSCAFSPDGRRIVSASGDNTLKLWDAATGAELATFTGHQGPVVSCAFSPDGQAIVSGSWDGTVRIWDVELKSAPQVLTGHHGWVRQVLFFPDVRRLISFGDDRNLRIWEAASGKLLRTFPRERERISLMAVSPDRRCLAAGFFDGRLKVFNPQTGSLRFTLSGHRDRIRGCAFSPDGSQILSGSNDSTLKVWDSRNGSLRYSIEAHDGAVSACAFSKDGSRFFSASEDNFLKLWDALTGKKICAYPVGAPALSAAWHRDGRRIAVGDATGKVHLLQLC